MRALISTLRFRITLLYVIVFGMTLLIFCVATYVVYQRNQAADLDAFLYRRAQDIAGNISFDARGQINIDPFRNEYIELRKPDGKSFARSNNLHSHSFSLSDQLLSQLQQGRPVYTTIFSSKNSQVFWGEGNLRLLSIPLIAQGQLQTILQLGMSAHIYEKSLVRLRTALFLIGIPLTLLLAGTGGWWLAGRAFRPINKIIAATQHLGADRLGERLPVPEVDDELKRLSLTLNEMLDRLEKAFKSQQRFVADASHELKTPLTIMQGELDILRQQPRSVEEYRTFLASASDELQRVSQIIQNLLLLARADSGKPLELKNDVRLDEVILTVMERLQFFVKQSQVQLSIKITENLSEGALTIRGDEDLLASLFFNLIHNAIKHSSAGQTVEIHLSLSMRGPWVAIRDYGTGIRAEDLPRIFDRFHRAASPTRRGVTGTGLGLAIARWIAEAHQAKISVESKPAEGSTFTVLFTSA